MNERPNSLRGFHHFLVPFGVPQSKLNVRFVQGVESVF